MAENIKNPLSNLSYTNKDFQTIFPEYLDLFKVLTTQYDPSSSNESDPLLILLKEQALLGDKLNYNSDKNILETFPLSVTQESNARQLYSQLGYSMNWYQAATGRVVIKYTGEKIIEEDEEDRGIAALKIPIFTQITDDDNETVYTTTKEITITDDNRTSADFDKSLEDNVIQGVPVEYTINNDNIIKIDNLDSNNRIYFDDYDIAENGIFISDANQEMFTSSWTLVDNLSVESLGNKYYEFGVLPNSNTCYIEFPSDIDNLIKNGIKIIYIKTKGVQGNIAANILTQFAQTVNANYSYLGDGWASYVPSKTKTLNRENIYITNPAKIANGKDIEDLESAYSNYKKTIGVFKTLVSLRDYNNYLNTQGKKDEQCSNGFVCDRTNDIQNVYYVITGSNQLSPLETIIEKDGNNKPKIGPFDLKLYLLQYVDKPDYSSQQYDLTFYPPKSAVDSYTNENDPILKLLDETKSIQHDFKAYEANKILYFLNKYPLNITIVPQYELTSLQQVEVTTNVIQALWSQLNSQKVDFGEEVLYETVYDIIKNADERIKAIVLNDVIFDTYAVYFDGSQYHQVLVGAETTPIGVNSDTTIENFQNEIFAKSVLKGNTPLLIPDETYKYNIIQNSASITDPTPDTEIKSIKTDVEITLNSDEYVLKDNETLTFIAPSLINVAQYGIYTKYFSNFTINANEETQITGDNHIIFFWKNSEDTVYKYHYYVVGDIVKSSFNIVANETYSTSTTVFEFGDDIDNLIDATSFGSHQGLLNVEGNVLTNANLEEVIKSSNVLSGQNYVAERKINNTELNFNTTEYPCYWITNTIETDNENNEYYVLFESKTSTANEDQTRILMPGEYFLYSNPEKTSLVLLGSGTKITRTIAASSTASEWKVKKTSNTDQIVSDGLKAFTEDMWFDLWKNNTTVNNINKFEIQEMQFYQFGKGYKVKSDIDEENNPFNSEEKDINGQISYVEIDENGQMIGDWENLPSISLTNENWQCFTTLSLSLSQTNPTPLLNNQYIICYKNTSPETSVFLWGNARGKKNLEYFNYDDLTDGHTVATLIIHPINSSSSNTTVWKMSNDQWTELTSGYTVDAQAGTITLSTALQEDERIKIEFVPIGTGTKLLSNMDLFILGGKNKNSTVIYNYLTGQKKYLTLYAYKDITSISNINTNIIYSFSDTSNLDGILNIKIPENTSASEEQTINLMSGNNDNAALYLPEGSYLICLEIPEDINFSSLCLKYGNDALSEYNISSSVSYVSEGIHYILFNQTSAKKALKLVYTLSSTIDKDYIVSIKKIFKFTNTDVLSSGKFTAVKSKIITLDVDGKYDWTHIVDKDTEIDNPLSGASFMNPNHIYNKYTICQIDNGKDLGGNKTSPYIYIANRVR